MTTIFCLVLVVLIRTGGCLAEITSSPGLQRVYFRDTCYFRWTISDSIVLYQIINQTSGSPPRQGASSVYDAAFKVITFTITNVQLWDAGNYSLMINGQSSNDANSACLYIYDSPISSVSLSSGPDPAYEGDTVELTCTIRSTSLPAEYRQKIYSTWNIGYIGWLQNVSSGPGVLINGDLVPGHSIKNDGRTLVIDSVKYPHDSQFQCAGLEEGSSLSFYSVNYFTLSMRYRPYVSYPSPSSRRLTAIVGTYVSFSFSYSAVPAANSITNWNFTDTSGNRRDLPPGSDQYNTLSHPTLQFNLPSEDYYGKYWITLANAIGSTTAEFQVLRPGPPETPSNIQLFYSSQSTINITWNIMFSNSIDNKQTVFVRVISQDTGLEIDTQNNSLSKNVNNVTTYSLLQNNIQPKSNYEVRLWAINANGQSEVVYLLVKTRSQPKLNVSPETISIDGSQAIINFTLVADDLENVTYVYATCCSDLTGLCASSLFQGRTAPNQIVINDLPSGEDYICDLTVKCGVYQRYEYFSAREMGIKVSRDGSFQNKNGTPSDPSSKSTSKDLINTPTLFPTTGLENRLSDKEGPYFVALIVLAVLLGVAALVLFGFLVACLIRRRRPSVQQTNLVKRANAMKSDDLECREKPKLQYDRPKKLPAPDPRKVPCT